MPVVTPPVIPGEEEEEELEGILLVLLGTGACRVYFVSSGVFLRMDAGDRK